MKSLIFVFFLTFLYGQSVPFKVGETLTYKAFFTGIEAGIGQLRVISLDSLGDKSAYRIRFSAQTKGFVDFLFSIDDNIDIWLDHKSLSTLKVNKKVREGKYKKDSKTTLYHEQGFALVDRDTVKIDKNVFSPYTLFYSLRLNNPTGLAGVVYHIIDGKTIMPLKLSVNENIEIRVPAGSYNCTKITPKRMDKRKFKNEATMSIWFSKDEHRYPVKIWLKLKFGALVLELEKISNSRDG